MIWLAPFFCEWLLRWMKRSKLEVSRGEKEQAEGAVCYLSVVRMLSSSSNPLADRR